MKLPFKKSEANKPRPYWHVDIKWVCGILLLVALAVTLPVAAAYRLTAKGPATDLVAYTFAGMTSPQGIDSDEGLGEIKARVLQNGSETVSLAGIDIVFTAEDFHTLSPRELRLKVFRAFADRFYDQGAKGFAESQGFDQATAQKFENDASVTGLFSAQAHKKVGTILFWMVLVDVLLIAALAFFSRRFGRLVSPGLVLLLVGLPGIIFAAISSQNPEVVGAARSETASDQFAALGLFANYVAPLVVPHFASVYLFALVSGGGLLSAAALGKIVYSIVHKNSAKAEGQKPEAPKGNDKKE